MNFGRLEALFARMLEEGLHYGAQLAVFRDGDCLLEIAGGVMRPGGAPVHAGTLFQIRSITKLLATIAVLRALDKGRFDLDDRVAKYWPEFGQSGKQDITVRHVLSHRAGIPDGPALAPVRLRERETVRREIEKMNPVWQPGAQNGYHAHTMGWVLQELVERWEGGPLEVLLKDEVLRPLHIHDVHLGLPAQEFPRMASMTVDDSVRAEQPRRAAMSDFVNSREGIALPIASVMGVATARDLAHLVGSVVNDQKILSGKALAAAAVPTNPPSYADLRLHHPIRWGLGFILGSTPDIYGATQRPDLLGHAGGGANVTWADPQSGLAVAFLCNRMLERQESWGRFRRIGDAVYAALEQG